MPGPTKRAVGAEHHGRGVLPVVGLGLLLSGSLAAFAFLEYVSNSDGDETDSEAIRIETPRPETGLSEPTHTTSPSPGTQSPNPAVTPVTGPSKRIDAGTSELRTAVSEMTSRRETSFPASRSKINVAPAKELPAAPQIANNVPGLADVPPQGEPSASSSISAEPGGAAQALPREAPPDITTPAEPTIIADGTPLTSETATGAAGTVEIQTPRPPTITLERPEQPQDQTFENWLAETASPDVGRVNSGPQAVTEPDVAPLTADTVPGLTNVPTHGAPSATSPIPAEPTIEQPAPTISGTEAAPYIPEATTGTAERLVEQPSTSPPEATPVSPQPPAEPPEPPTSAYGILPRSEASPLDQSRRSVDQSPPSPELFVQSYPLIVLKGVEVGAVPMRISSDNVISIYLGSFLSLFESRMDPVTFQRLRNAKTADQYVTLEVLRSFGLDMTYDRKLERLMLDVE